MYYPSLMNMKINNNIRKRDIELLDEWLIRRPIRNRGSLNFLQFSIDEDINEEIALQLFIAATKKEVGVLSIYYNVVTDDRMQSLGVYYSKKEIPKKIYNFDTDEEISIKDSNIEIKFKLIAFPSKTLSWSNEDKKEEKIANIPTIEGVKKVPSLQGLFDGLR